jgi:tRNA-binding EMAP/Myf-like protein
MTIVKKWEIEKGKGYTVFIGAHVVQKGEKCSVNKYIVRYRITPYFIQSNTMLCAFTHDEHWQFWTTEYSVEIQDRFT